MDINDISPYVRYAAKSVLCSPFQIGPRIILDYELVFIESGRFLLLYDENEYLCQKGDVLLFCPGHRHTMKSITNISVSQPHIHFDMKYDEHSEDVFISFKDLPDFKPEEKLLIRPDFFSEIGITPVLAISDSEHLKQCLFEIIALYSEQPVLSPLLMKQKMLELLYFIFRDNTSFGDTIQQPELNLPLMIQKFLDYHFYNRISLDSLEKQFHYSKFYISRSFVEYVGTPVIQYYNQKRLEYAKKQLMEGQSVTEITKSLHFSSIYTFSRFFKTHEGCSPTEFKRDYGARMQVR